MSSSQIPPPPSGPSDDEPSMVGGGIYFRWNGRLWQEQADGSFLVWEEDTHSWQPSSVQPPPQAGETRETKECPNCGKRVKASLRHCPYCEFGFEDRATRRPAPEATPAPRQKRSVPPRVVLLLIAFLVAGAATGAFLFQRNRSCDNWQSAVDELTQAKIELQGLPNGTTEEEFRALNEALLADQRPGGCE